MCGIIGYNGYRNAKGVIIECLKKLEYRGYDSAGIGVVGNKLQIFKEIGEISKLEKTVPELEGDIGIGHTRWATHGGVTQQNAHPQVDKHNKIAVIHNGIIENFKKIKEDLEKKGIKFKSQTDTEVIAHLINQHYQGDLKDAVFKAIKHIQGSYAILTVCEDEPDLLIGVRNESPLVVGIGDNENFIASDIPALLKYTNRVIYLDDKEMCIVKKNKVTILNQNQEVQKKDENIINWDVKDAEKSGFSHFMLKEIYDQPDSINQVYRGRISEIERNVEFPEKVENLCKNGIDSIHIVACGTSYYAGLVGKHLLENLTNIPVHVDLASEYRYFGVKNQHSLVIGITQSGETADTLAALKEAKNVGCNTLVVTNVIGSSATRISDAYILTQSGPEIGVAATKTFTSQILVMFLIALKIGLNKRTMNADELYKHIINLKELTSKVRQVINDKEKIIEIAKKIKNAKSVFFIGRGINYPLSLEGALKLKEISYIHAEGFAAGELKHGPFALLTDKTPVVAIVAKDLTYHKMIANIGEIKARGPEVIAIAEEEDPDIEKYVDYVITYPKNLGILCSVPIIVILQLLAYHVAKLNNCPIDKPRNLAKSVTVE